MQPNVCCQLTPHARGDGSHAWKITVLSLTWIHADFGYIVPGISSGAGTSLRVSLLLRLWQRHPPVGTKTV